ncbi:MAG: AAA family ATPase [Thomasclavelia sp.]
MEKRIPVGIENFKELIDDGYYYIDKTDLTSDVLDEIVVFYTRPRRFGKTLSMSMLYYFFSNKEKDNAYLFDNLKITKDKEALKHQNQYPVIFITLKDMKSMDFNKQKEKFANIIKNIIIENKELLNSSKIDRSDKIILNDLRFLKASDVQLSLSLKTISRCMQQHYHKEAIILIDEYDVPLQCAYDHKYYDQMVNFLSGVFSAALKTNDAVEKGVLTGCLRFSKESVFTGFNNYNMRSIMDDRSSNRFGFTLDEVKQLLADYHLDEYLDEVKQWYNGYLFGENEIYNPWSTLKYVDLKTTNPKSEPESFWANTSEHEIVYKYIEESNYQQRKEFDSLLKDECVIKTVKEEITYREMDDIVNIYSFLLFTGYLKCIKKQKNQYWLKIPNQEIKYIYENIFKEWFDKKIESSNNSFQKELMAGNAIEARKVLNDLLSYSISYFDYNKSFYHGFLLGLLNGLNVKSNREAGKGRYDIAVIPNDFDNPLIIIECKYVRGLNKLKQMSEEAAIQIKERNYEEEFKDQGYENIISYGIAFYKKQCYITQATSSE